MSLLGNGKNYLSPVNDPFNKDSLESVWISIRRRTFEEGYNISGKVEFKNGDTKAEQQFKGETFDDCVLKIKVFIESLP